jgi:hypothetical protein
MKHRVFVKHGSVWFLGTYDDAAIVKGVATVTLDAGFDLPDVPVSDIYVMDGIVQRNKNGLPPITAKKIWLESGSNVKNAPFTYTQDELKPIAELRQVMPKECLNLRT